MNFMHISIKTRYYSTWLEKTPKTQKYFKFESKDIVLSRVEFDFWLKTQNNWLKIPRNISSIFELFYFGSSYALAYISRNDVDLALIFLCWN